jgi:ATP-dependent RNA helicase RhlE
MRVPIIREIGCQTPSGWLAEDTMSFTEFTLDERLQRALVTAGFEEPTPIQVAALPVALAGRDLVGTAQTGTGKTAAFVLPILNKLIAIPLAERKTRAVILAPTRELVEQILTVIRELGRHTNVRAVAVYGGVPMLQQSRALRSGVEIVIACPGRLLDHLAHGNADLRHLDWLVLDEADRMLDMGFMPPIEAIIDQMPVNRQTLLFSATFPATLNAFVARTLRDPVRVKVNTAVPPQAVRHCLYTVKSNKKFQLLTAVLRDLVAESGSVLIFTRTRATADEVAESLRKAGLRGEVLHAEKTQEERQATMERFRAGRFPYLVATDIAARGLDVPGITHVINFDLPDTASDYLHRVGRTGRMERAGQAISLVTRGDGRMLREIERMLDRSMDVATMDGFDEQDLHDDSSTPPDRQLRQPPAPKPRAATRSDAPPPKGGEARPAKRPATQAPARDDRPHLLRDAKAPSVREERRRKEFGPATSTGRPPRAERPERAERPARSGRPARTDRPAHPAHSDHPDQAERPQRPQYPSYSDRPDRPARADRPERTDRAERSGRTARADHADRPGRPDRRRIDTAAPTAPSRGDRSTPAQGADAPVDESHQTRPGGRRFKGLAAASQRKRSHAASKRQPGEVPSTPRPPAKPAALDGAPPARKRTKHRGH